MTTNLSRSSRSSTATVSGHICIQSTERPQQDSRKDVASEPASTDRKRVLAQLAAGNAESAENDITRALAGMDRKSKDAYLRSTRTQLEELRKRL
ncbi:MAG: hypothetical protein ACR2M5_14250 [Nakamurella sp.]